mmetsp:Transcript_29111/g.43879  ORF Transcript_29111/g.43879 Transcript_29111/m.43879 type:complete len:81 (-) Transcript_29111:482-724(-)
MRRTAVERAAEAFTKVVNEGEEQGDQGARLHAAQALYFVTFFDRDNLSCESYEGTFSGDPRLVSFIEAWKMKRERDISSK